MNSCGSVRKQYIWYRNEAEKTDEIGDLGYTKKEFQLAARAEAFSDFVEGAYGFRLYNVPTKSVLKLEKLYLENEKGTSLVFDMIRESQLTGKTPSGKIPSKKYPNLSERMVLDMIHVARFGHVRSRRI